MTDSKSRRVGFHETAMYAAAVQTERARIVEIVKRKRNCFNDVAAAVEMFDAILREIEGGGQRPEAGASESELIGQVSRSHPSPEPPTYTKDGLLYPVQPERDLVEWLRRRVTITKGLIFEDDRALMQSAADELVALTARLEKAEADAVIFQGERNDMEREIAALRRDYNLALDRVIDLERYKTDTTNLTAKCERLAADLKHENRARRFKEDELKHAEAQRDRAVAALQRHQCGGWKEHVKKTGRVGCNPFSNACHARAMLAEIREEGPDVQ